MKVNFQTIDKSKIDFFGPDSLNKFCILAGSLHSSFFWQFKHRPIYDQKIMLNTVIKRLKMIILEKDGQYEHIKMGHLKKRLSQKL